MNEEDAATEEQQRHKATSAAEEQAREARADFIKASVTAEGGSRLRKKRRNDNSDEVSHDEQLALGLGSAISAPRVRGRRSRSSSPGSPSNPFCFEHALTYFQGITTSPQSKRGKLAMEEKELDIEEKKLVIEQKKVDAMVQEAAARRQGTSLRREVVKSYHDSPDTKQRRKDVEAKDVDTRKLETESRSKLQQGMLDMMAKMMEKLN